jgi:prophage regulatory protein
MQQFQIIRAKRMPDIIGLSLPTIYRLLQKGDFPKQIKLSTRAVGWDTRDIEIWVDGRRAQNAAGGGV